MMALLRAVSISASLVLAVVTVIVGLAAIVEKDSTARLAGWFLAGAIGFVSVLLAVWAVTA